MAQVVKGPMGLVDRAACVDVCELAVHRVVAGAAHMIEAVVHMAEDGVDEGSPYVD